MNSFKLFRLNGNAFHYVVYGPIYVVKTTVLPKSSNEFNILKCLTSLSSLYNTMHSFN